MTRWQYTVVNLGSFFAGERLVSTLARLGADGWELVTIYDKSSNWLAGMEKGFALFKRPVADGEDVSGPWARSLGSENATTNDVSEGQIDHLLSTAEITMPGAAAGLAGSVPSLDGLARCSVSGHDGIVVLGGDHLAAWTPASGLITSPIAAFGQFRSVDGSLVLEDSDGLELVVTPRPQAMKAFVKLLRGAGLSQT